MLDCRPVTIYAILYRLWLSTRARAALRHLEQYCDFAMYGFLPGREAAQYFHEQQATVEICLQTRENRTGWCSDLEKCFNSLARYPIILLGRHLGLPVQWLTAWLSFLGGNTRRFQIRGSLGSPIFMQGRARGMRFEHAGHVYRRHVLSRRSASWITSRHRHRVRRHCFDLAVILRDVEAAARC